jgi:nitrogen fixation protein FixH
MSLRASSKSGAVPREVSGRMVLICLVAFFVVVAGVNAVMIGAAVMTFGGVETANSYQAGLAFGREIAAVAAQDARYWQVRAKVTAVADETLIEIFATDADGRPLAHLDATALLAHPADRRADHNVPLTEVAPGRHQGRTGAIIGQWALVIELSRNGERVFRSRNRVFLR